MAASRAAFRYRAVDLADREKSGIVEAGSRAEALADLADRGLVVVELIAAPIGSAAAGSGGTARRFGLFDASPSVDEVQTLTAEWARCLDVGLTIADAVAISAEGRNGTRLGRTTDAIRAALRRGLSLRQALAEHVPRFPTAALSLIEAAERSGRLGPTLALLAERLGQQRRLRREIRSALVYPAFVVVTAIAVVSILLLAVVPAIDEIIGDRRDALPLTAQLVLRASGVFRERAFEILVGSVFLGALALGALFHPAARPSLDRLRLRIPFVGPLLLANDAAQFARALAAQVGGGVTLGRATRLSISAFALAPVRAAANDLERKLSEGLALSDALAADLPRLPRELVQFTRVGERTGRLAVLLEHAADILEEQARRQARTLASLVTPAITIGLGLLVGFIVLSMMNAVVGLNAVALR